MRPFSPSRGVRVHPYPDFLPRRPRFEDGEVARNRFDDPAGEYVVRYVATTLRGCLLEVMASFRPREPLEARLRAVTNADAEPGDLVDLDGKEMEFAGTVPVEWLDAQRVGRCWVREDAPFVDVLDAWFLAEHNRNPRVRHAIDGHLGEHYDLDAATILLNLDLGRPVTQAVSATAWERTPRPGGIRYLSRLDISEECWAIFEDTAVGFDSIDLLRPDVEEHREAVTSVAALLELRLPLPWDARSGDPAQ